MQERFVREYLLDLNASDAARRAGYSAKTAPSQGGRLLKNVAVATAIRQALNKRSEKLELSAEWVLNNLRTVAERCLQAEPVRERVDGEWVQKTDADGHLVWEFDSSGANRSLELLGKHLGMFTDKHEISGTGGRAISISIGGLQK
jgi:phage terminase small subunit